MKIQKLGLGGIGIRTTERLRKLRTEVVEELMQSMAVSGMLNPITVRPKGPAGNGYWLIAGWHRLEAARKLKWDSVEAHVVTDKDATHAALIEIDENLIRAELSPAERAAHHAKRKKLYDDMQPKTCSVAGCQAPILARGLCSKHYSQHSRKGMLNAKQNDHNDLRIRRNRKNYADSVAKPRRGKGAQTIRHDVALGMAIPDIVTLTDTCLDKRDELNALAKLPPDEQRDLMERAKAGEKVSAKTRLKQLARDARERELAGKICALPTRKYGVILADPEWRFEPWSRETGMDRAADNHYPTSCTEVIAARDVPSIAAKDCVLFLCATAPMLLHAAVVMAAWGFNYVTNAELHKDREITGYWFRNRHEHLLLGIRGKVPCPAPGTQWESVIEMIVGRHSEKPEAIYEMIEAYFPNLPKIELNCRGAPRPGWDGWGAEAEIAEAAE